MSDAIEQARYEAAERFPLADLEDAATNAEHYADDPRNRGVVLPDSQEAEVRVMLVPAPEDPTGEPVELVGHVDQIRRVNGSLRVWDVKNGKPSGIDMLYSYAWQLAAYAVACTETFGEPVTPGGIIRLRGYRTRQHYDPGEQPVFFEAPWTLQQCHTMLATVVQHVAWLRLGLVHLQPGAQCAWCPAGGPHLCADAIRDATETAE